MRQAELADQAAGAAGAAPAPAGDLGWRRAALVVAVLTSILFFARLGTRALWASEFRWAEIAREMILTRNYFWPTINGHVYYDKPLGSYWLVVAMARMTGGMSELAARLPSALAGLLAVILVTLLGRRLYDARIGVMAGTVLGSSFSFVFFSRHADADVETIAGALAVLLLYWKRRDSLPGWWTVALWSLMAVTSLTKGLLGFVLPLLVIGVYASFAADNCPNSSELPWTSSAAARKLRLLIWRNRWFFNPYTPLAIGCAALIYYGPFAMSHAETGSSKGLYMVYRENVERYFAPFDHVGPIYLYTYVIFALMAPWSAFLPAALAHAHRSGYRRSSGDRFVLVFFWVTFIFFTLSGSRRSYYLLPILPAGALLEARLFAEPTINLGAWPRRLLKAGFAVMVAAVAISITAFLPPRLFLPYPWSLLPPAPDRGMLAIFWIGSVVAISYAAIGYASRGFDGQRIFFATAVIAWLFMFYFFVFAMPAGDAWRGEKQFALRVRALIDGDSSGLAFYNTGGPLYYLDLTHPVPAFNTRRQLNSAIGSGRFRWIVMRERDAESLRFEARVAAREPVFAWDSHEHSLNAMVLVRIDAPAEP